VVVLTAKSLARMKGVQAFVLCMEKESQNQYMYGKSHKEYKKPTSTIKNIISIKL